jgi:peptidyl-prolyl cis-trans isomerase B (cyclophilin B)
MQFSTSVVFRVGVAFFLCLFISSALTAQEEVKIRNRDRKKDVLMITTFGEMRIRLSDSTPLHRDNFLVLVKKKFYDGILFHRVIQQFMIQAGDPGTKTADPNMPAGSGGPGYTIPAEFKADLFHKKGALAAARTGDQVNPLRASSGSQFYIVQGRLFSDAGLDSVETYRLEGKKINPEHREVYRSIGGTPQLDMQYTVFGEVVQGLEVVDRIAAVPTSKGSGRDKPLEDVRIVEVKLVRRSGK